MNKPDTSRLDLLALKLRSGLPLSPEDQGLWDRGASLRHKVAAGLPLTPDEQTKWEHLKNVRMSVRNGALWVEPPPLSMDEWKTVIAKARAQPVKLVEDTGTDKSQTSAETPH